MAGFFKKLFGGKAKSANEVEDLVIETLSGILENSGLELTFKTNFEKEDDGFGHPVRFLQKVCQMSSDSVCTRL